MSRLHVVGSTAVSIKADWPVGIEVSPVGVVNLTLAADQDATRPLKLTVVFLPPNFGPASLDAGTMLSSYPKSDAVDVPAAVAGVDTHLTVTKTGLNPGNYTAVVVGEFAV